VIDGTANGVPFGRRTIKAWGKGTDDWFVEFTAPICKAASLGVGDRVALELRIADASAPSELQNILSKNRSAAAAWVTLSKAERRNAGEHIRAAKAPATRQRRAMAIVERLRGELGK
jgi:hypothetical protein